MVRRFLALPHSALVATALAIVYVVWGSTYLAIRVGLDSFPPFLLAGIRFLLAGGVLYALTIRRGDAAGDRPGRPQWLGAVVVGGLLLVGGNGAVTWAEQTVPSGIAALLVATVALWMPLLGWLMYRERLTWRAVVGLAIGFAGVAILVQPGSPASSSLVGMFAVLFGSVSWAVGSLLSRRLSLPARPLVATAMEMLAAGAMFMVLSAATGEFGRFEPAAVTLRSASAVAYLAVFGSIVAFSAYIWLLRTVDTSVVSTYAYVNPAVAVVLGWGLLAEPLDVRTVVAGGVIIAAVALIVSARSAGQPDRQEGLVALPDDEVSLAR